MKARLLVLVVVLGLMCVPVLADSVGLVTFTYTGIVGSVVDVNGALDSSIFVGQSFSGSYTFDPTTPDSLPFASSNIGLYEWRNNFVMGFTADFSIGNYAFGLSPIDPSGQVTISDNNGPILPNNIIEDAYIAAGQLVQTSGPLFPLAGGQANWGISFKTETNLAVITSDALPIIPPDISLFETNVFSFTNNPGEIVIKGVITSLEVASVPEPSTFTLLAVGLMGLGVFRKRFS